MKLMQHVPLVEHFLAEPVFRYFLFPIGSALFGIWIKMEIRVGRPKQEDFAVGPELIRGSLLMLVALTCARATSLDALHQSLNVVKDPVEIAQLQAHSRVASTGLDWNHDISDVDPTLVDYGLNPRLWVGIRSSEPRKQTSASKHRNCYT